MLVRNSFPMFGEIWTEVYQKDVPVLPPAKPAHQLYSWRENYRKSCYVCQVCGFRTISVDDLRKDEGCPGKKMFFKHRGDRQASRKPVQRFKCAPLP